MCGAERKKEPTSLTTNAKTPKISYLFLTRREDA
jgi:hypothetical protein